MKNRLDLAVSTLQQKSQVNQPLVLFKVVGVFLIINCKYSKPQRPVKHPSPALAGRRVKMRRTLLIAPRKESES